MSLTSYRAAPPRANGFARRIDVLAVSCAGFDGSRVSGSCVGRVRSGVAVPVFVGRATRSRPSWGRSDLTISDLIMKREKALFRARIWSGGDLLSHVLRRSTIGAAGLNGRVRDGIGCFPRAMTTRPGKKRAMFALLSGCGVCRDLSDALTVLLALSAFGLLEGCFAGLTGFRPK